MDYSFEEMSASQRRPVMDIFNYFIANTHAAYPATPLAYTLFNRFLEMIRGYPASVINATLTCWRKRSKNGY